MLRSRALQDQEDKLLSMQQELRSLKQALVEKDLNVKQCAVLLTSWQCHSNAVLHVISIDEIFWP